MKKIKTMHGKALSCTLSLLMLLSTVFTALSVTAQTADDFCYGTAEEGIIKESGDALKGIRIGAREITTDFSEGLKYWGASENRTGSASEYASVENGILTVHYSNRYDVEGNTLARNYDGIESVRIELPEEIKGKTVGFIAEVERATSLSMRIYTSGGKQKAYTYNYSASNTGWYKISTMVETEETDEYVYLLFNLMSEPDAAAAQEYKVRELRIGYMNESGIFTDFQGNLWNTAYQYNTPYYGTEEDGIYTTSQTGVYAQNLVGTDKFNGDFSEGLKYWSSYGINGEAYASDSAKVKDGALEMTADSNKSSYYNVISAGVNIPEGLAGKKIGVAFTMDSPSALVMVGVRTNLGSEKSVSLSGRTARTKALSDYTIGEEDKVVYIRFQQTNSGSTSYGAITRLDDIIIFTYDDQNDTVGYTFSGEPVNLSYYINYYMYGSEEKGIYTDNSNAVSTLGEVEKVMNTDFESGLKYWGPRNGLYGFASEYAAVENGMLKIEDSSGMYNGVRSVKFSIPETAYGKKIVINYDIKSNDTVYFNLYSENSEITGWKIYKSSTDGKTENVTSGIGNALQLTEGDRTLSVEIQLNGSEEGNSYAYIDNIKFCIVDEGGTELPAELDGSPLKYEYGDVNADGSRDIKDMIRLKKYLTSGMSGEYPAIYLAAANTDKSADLTIDTLDLIQLQKIFLNYKRNGGYLYVQQDSYIRL